MNDNDFNTIILIRINVMPPYTYDEDECERDISEYIEYFNININMSILATTEYINAISNFRNDKIESNFKNVLESRKLFIKFLPFAYDEIESEDEEFGVEYMRKIFLNDAEMEILQQNLEEYLGSLHNIKEKC